MKQLAAVCGCCLFISQAFSSEALIAATERVPDQIRVRLRAGEQDPPRIETLRSDGVDSVPKLLSFGLREDVKLALMSDPSIAHHRGGYALCMAAVDVDGSVASSAFAGSSTLTHGFAALAVLDGWRFRAAKKSGRNVRCWVYYRLKFRLLRRGASKRPATQDMVLFVERCDDFF
jgi:hypothetical protein